MQKEANFLHTNPLKGVCFYKFTIWKQLGNCEEPYAKNVIVARRLFIIVQY